MLLNYLISEVAGNANLKERWLPELSKCSALGAFAVHEPDAGSNAGAISTKATCASQADAVPSNAALNGFKAKLYASEMAVETTNKAIQALGGHGYIVGTILLSAFSGTLVV